MSDELYEYYERELAYLRQLGVEFANKHPERAGLLGLEPDKCEDPHVERLLEGFAFLAARVQHKLDDDFPEIANALLQVVYPHFLNPMPAMSTVQFSPDPTQGKLTSGHTIARGARLYTKQLVDGVACRFRTVYPVTLWPLEVAAAELVEPDRWGPSPRAASMIKLHLRCVGEVAFADLDIDRIRFHLYGFGGQKQAHQLYELLFSRLIEVQLRPLDARPTVPPIRLRPEVVCPVGFERDDAILPYGNRSFLGYRFIQEYFTFPDKFLYVDLVQLGTARTEAFRSGVEIRFVLDRRPSFEQSLGAEAFRLGCTPVVNLFGGDGAEDRFIAEPIRLTETESEYRVVPDAYRVNGAEIYSVDRVVGTRPGSDEIIPFEPFYAFRHASKPLDRGAYWYATRRASPRDGAGEVYLSLVDLDFRPAEPGQVLGRIDGATLSAFVTCTNRDLVARLQGYGGGRGDFELEGQAPLARIVCLRAPTEPVRPTLGRSVQWRLISHLSLNYLSMVDGGSEALREILSLYQHLTREDIRQQIEGIAGIESRRTVTLPPSMPRAGFCRGLEVTLSFDKNKFTGSGVFLFAQVLERFLGLYASLNSFTRLIATTQDGVLKKWPPRAGEQSLL